MELEKAQVLAQAFLEKVPDWVQGLGNLKTSQMVMPRAWRLVVWLDLP